MPQDMPKVYQYAPPPGYEGAFVLPASSAAAAAPGGASVGLIPTLKKVDTTSLGVAEIAITVVVGTIVMGTVVRRLMTTGERVQAISGGEPSWIPQDTAENRAAFERRFGKAGS